MKTSYLLGITLGLCWGALLLIMPAVPVAGLGANAALLVDCDENNTTTFNGGINSSWTQGGNWSFGVPDSNKCAVIPADDDGDEHFDVVIPGSTTAYCKTLTIEDEGDDRSTLFLTGGSTLVLGDGGTLTSTIDGQFDLSVHPSSPATLKIDGVHTVQGNGGAIVLNKGP
ncbi:MAG: hypothetical protein IT449_12855 [Phycisphaerales bacterium]|nr:hypothetical protein [Phycisphaerales bacterium]